MGVMNEDRLTLYDGLIKTHITNTTVAKETGKGLSTNDYTTTEKNKLAGINKDLLDKLGESTEGNLTFNGDEINAAQMTGATADKDGTSGTVPAPKAGQENHVLKGNGAWESLTYDSELSAESENAPKTKVVDAKTKKIEENLSQLSNPNLLINPDFKINQRGGKISVFGAILYSDPECTVSIGHAQDTDAVTVIKVGNNYRWKTLDYGPVYIKASDVVDGYCAAGYTVDRWRTYYDGLTVKLYDDHIELINDTDENKFFGQAELNLFKSLYGKSLTASIEAESALGTSTFYSGYVKDNVYNVLYSVEINKERSILSQTFTVNETDCSKYEICTIQILSHDTVKVYWVKLELGSVATPFVPPDPTSELLKCQRYYKKYLLLPVLRNIQGLDYFGISTPDVFRVSPDIDGGGGTYIASALGEPDFEINIIERIGTGGTNGTMQWFKIVKSDGSSIDPRITSMEIHNIAFDAEIR